MSVEDRLRQDLANCDAERERIRGEIGSLQREEIALGQKINYIRSVLQDAPADPNQHPLIAVERTATPRRTLIDVAEEILTAAGGRLKMDEIVDRAISGKYRDASTPDARRKLRANLSSVLSHHSRSENPKIMKSKKRGYYKLPSYSTNPASGVTTVA